MSVNITPYTSFLTAWKGVLSQAFSDYTVTLFGDIPSRKEDCPKLLIDFLGSKPEPSTSNRIRRITGHMRLHLGFHKWADKDDNDKNRQALAFNLLDEYSRNERIISESFRIMRTQNVIPDGLQLTGSGHVTGTTFLLPANSRSAVISSTFLIQELPLEFTTAED